MNITEEDVYYFVEKHPSFTRIKEVAERCGVVTVHLDYNLDIGKDLLEFIRTSTYVSTIRLVFALYSTIVPVERDKLKGVYDAIIANQKIKHIYGVNYNIKDIASVYNNTPTKEIPLHWETITLEVITLDSTKHNLLLPLIDTVERSNIHSLFLTTWVYDKLDDATMDSLYKFGQRFLAHPHTKALSILFRHNSLNVFKQVIDLEKIYMLPVYTDMHKNVVAFGANVKYSKEVRNLTMYLPSMEYAVGDFVSNKRLESLTIDCLVPYHHITDMGRMDEDLRIRQIDERQSRKNMKYFMKLIKTKLNLHRLNIIMYPTIFIRELLKKTPVIETLCLDFRRFSVKYTILGSFQAQIQNVSYMHVLDIIKNGISNKIMKTDEIDKIELPFLHTLIILGEIESSAFFGDLIEFLKSTDNRIDHIYIDDDMYVRYAAYLDRNNSTARLIIDERAYHQSMVPGAMAPISIKTASGDVFKPIYRQPVIEPYSYMQPYSGSRSNIVTVYSEETAPRYSLANDDAQFLTGSIVYPDVVEEAPIVSEKRSLSEAIVDMVTGYSPEKKKPVVSMDERLEIMIDVLNDEPGPSSRQSRGDVVDLTMYDDDDAEDEDIIVLSSDSD